jgi:hypothetical protein
VSVALADCATALIETGAVGIAEVGTTRYEASENTSPLMSSHLAI